MTHFGFNGNHLKCFKVVQMYFVLQKPQTKDTVQMEVVLVINETANTKTALYTYLRLTLDGNYLG